MSYQPPAKTPRLHHCILHLPESEWCDDCMAYMAYEDYLEGLGRYVDALEERGGRNA